MNLSHVILREIIFRKLNFALGVLSVGAAVACLVGALAMLAKHDVRTERIIAAKQAETRAKMATLEDDYRKITKKLGFNVLILPREQNLSDFFTEDFATKYMPEEYVERSPSQLSDAWEAKFGERFWGANEDITKRMDQRYYAHQRKSEDVPR